MRALDLCAGAGGWDIAGRALDIEADGVEMMPEACLTRAAAGLRTVLADMRDATRKLDLAIYEGLIASPPCQTFSMAGKGAGREKIALFLHLIERFNWTPAPSYNDIVDAVGDEGAALVVEPLRVALAMMPRWIAFEQVPTVLPIWEECAKVLRNVGYSVVTGNVQAEQYGVPQTRKRAVLLARRDGIEARFPAPTHSKFHTRDRKRLDDGVLPWVSMAQALGWGMDARPSMTVMGGGVDTGGAEPFAHGSRDGMKRELAEGRWLLESNYSAPGQPGQSAAERGLGTRELVEPASAVTSKAFRFKFLGAGNTSSDTAGVQPRDDDEPAHTITGKGTAAWRVQTGQNSEQADGTLERYTRSVEEPSPTILHNTKAWTYQSSTQEHATERTVEQPAPTIAFGNDANSARWAYRNGTHAKAGVRDQAEPAPTIMFGGRQNTVDWVADRPATTVNGDPRIASPGHKDRSNGGESQFAKDSVRVTVIEAAILQSFPADYPWQGSKTKQYLQVGNAIPPLLAWHLLREISSQSEE